MSKPALEQHERYGWVVISILRLGDIFVAMTGFTLGILLPDITKEFSLSPVQQGILGTVFFLGFALFSLPTSLWLTRYSPRRVVLIAITGASLLLFLQGWSPVFAVLLLGRFLFVVLAVSRSAPEVLLMSQWFKPGQIALVNSFAFGVFGIGQTIGLLLAPFLLLALGSWREVYYLFGLGLLVVALLWLLLGRERQGQEAPASRESLLAPARAVLRRGDIWMLAACQVGASVAFASYLTFWPTFMVEEHSFSLKQAGPLLSLYAVGGIAGSFASGPISNLLRSRKFLIWPSGLALPFLYLGLLMSQSPLLLAILLSGAGFFAFVSGPIIVTIPFDLNLKPREIAIAIALTRTLNPLGGAMGPFLVGAVQQLTGSLSWGLLVVVPFPITLLLAGLLLPETSPLRRRPAVPLAGSERKGG
jgi:predicted MFS family arabinose efflux permease